MDKNAIFAGVIATFTVFTYLSLPILQDMYGPAALLGVYGGIAVLIGILTYIITNKIAQVNISKSNNSESNSDKNDVDEESEDDIVETEVENLKNNN